MNKVIGVVGMCGSGKSVLTEYLCKKGWKKVYFGGVTIEELQKRGLSINEKNERCVRESLRAEHGAAAYAIKLAPIIQSELEYSNVVLDGLYSWHEYSYLKKKFGNDFIVLAVVTNRNKRYERLMDRKIRPLLPENAYKRDVAEIENLAKGGPIAIADYYIVNNDSESAFYEQIEEVLAECKLN